MTIDEFKKNVAPYLKRGWVAMQPDKSWCWFENKPEAYNCQYSELREMILMSGIGWDDPNELDNYLYLSCFDIEPVKDWTKSLIEVGV